MTTHDLEIETHDLATLPNLNEETMLSFLKKRYKSDIIYVIHSTKG
jgi:myosin heavy subunit